MYLYLYHPVSIPTSSTSCIFGVKSDFSFVFHVGAIQIISNISTYSFIIAPPNNSIRIGHLQRYMGDRGVRMRHQEKTICSC